MALFSDITSHTSKFWKGLGTGPRVTLLSFVGATVLLVVGFSVWSNQPDYVLLYGGLSPEDAAAISTRLNDDKIAFRYEPSRGAIYVTASKATDARLALSAQGLPKNSTEGFELFDKISFGTTEYVQRVNYLRALQGSLARSLQSMEAIDTATVSLSIPEDDVFKRDAREAKASVMVRLRTGRSLQRENIQAIRHLVASSVPKLKIQNVAVMDSTGRLFSRFEDDDSAALLAGHVMSDDEFTSQHRIESTLADKVQTLLEKVVGPGQAAVRVTAQLNLERVVRDLQKIDPDSQVLLEESTRSEDAGSAKAPGGAPGTASNVPDANASNSSGGAGARKQKELKNRYDYNITKEHIIPESGGIKRLSIAVLVAPNKAAGSDEFKPRSPKEMEALTDIVRMAVGFSADRQDSIKIEEMPFNPSALPVAGIEPGAQTNYWFDLARTYFPDALALAGIVVMAFVFRRIVASLPAAALAPVAVPKSIEEPVVPLPVVRRSERPPPKSAMATSADEVKELVNKNNTQAINLIRSMLN